MATVFFAKLVGRFHYQNKFGQWLISWYILINYVNHKHDTVVTVTIENDKNDEMIDITDDGRTTNNDSLAGLIQETYLYCIGASMAWFAHSVILMIVFGNLVTEFIFPFSLFDCDV